MAFPTDHKDARDAYCHLKNFGQETHAKAVYKLAENLRLLGEEMDDLRKHCDELEKKQGRASYEEIRNKDLERRVRNRPAANE